MRLSEKVSIVTGASSGMGRAIAIAFANEGSKVLATGRDESRLAEVKQQILENDGECVTISADVTVLERAKDIVTKTIETYGRIDILVNSAGIFELSDFFEINESFFTRTMEVNFKSIFFMCQQAGLVMKNQGKGKIINLSSIGGGQIGFPTGSVYCASKAAVAALTQALALVLSPHNITVNAISPGNIKTP